MIRALNASTQTDTHRHIDGQIHRCIDKTMNRLMDGNR